MEAEKIDFDGQAEPHRINCPVLACQVFTDAMVVDKFTCLICIFLILSDPPPMGMNLILRQRQVDQ